jgi:4-hydroxybenzoate polyprenyltransferase
LPTDNNYGESESATNNYNNNKNNREDNDTPLLDCNQGKKVSLNQQRMTPPLLELHRHGTTSRDTDTANHNNEKPSLLSSAVHNSTSKSDTVWQQLGPLTRLTRPHNFPGIFLFHLIGIYITLQSTHRLDVFSTFLLASPAMWLVFASVLLVSSTSMVVNDYYDAKLGRDTISTDTDHDDDDHHHNTNHPLVSGDLSFRVVRRYLSYLYAAALLISTVLPGALARFSVIVSLMLTYWYTNHLKPLTWIKNAVCAFLIAFAPLTSSSATLHLLTTTATTTPPTNMFVQVFQIVPLWRVVTMLFVGILGREITMDCNDVQNDGAVGVRTIPVVYGSVFASRVALACAGMASTLALMGPIYQGWNRNSGISAMVWQRRLVLASIASTIQMIGAIKVWKTQGRNRQVVSTAVDNGAATILLFLASYL